MNQEQITTNKKQITKNKKKVFCFAMETWTRVTMVSSVLLQRIAIASFSCVSVCLPHMVVKQQKEATYLAVMRALALLRLCLGKVPN